MPRPQVYDRDAILDAAEELAVQRGVKAVTIRAVSERAGISNGAIYHAFGSRGGLAGRAWVRAARRFLALQREAVDAQHDPVRADRDGLDAALDSQFFGHVEYRVAVVHLRSGHGNQR